MRERIRSITHLDVWVPRLSGPQDKLDEAIRAWVAGTGKTLTYKRDFQDPLALQSPVLQIRVDSQPFIEHRGHVIDLVRPMTLHATMSITATYVDPEHNISVFNKFTVSTSFAREFTAFPLSGDGTYIWNSLLDDALRRQLTSILMGELIHNIEISSPLDITYETRLDLIRD